MGFPVLDKYMSVRLEVDVGALAPGRTLVNEWRKWPRQGKSGKWACVVHWVWFEDDRCTLSVPPGFKEAFAPIVANVERSEAMLEPATLKAIRPLIDRAAAESHLHPVKDEDVFQALILGCNESLFKSNDVHEVKRLQDRNDAIAEGVILPDECSPEGIAYGALEEGKVVAVAFARDTGIMHGQVAEVSVHTSPEWRGKGYGEAVVSRVMDHVISAGGEVSYRVSPGNAPSVAIAKTLGCVPYAKYIHVSAGL